MEWQWHQLDHMQITCTWLQEYNHSRTSSLNFLQVGCSSKRPINSFEALKENGRNKHKKPYLYSALL